MAQMLFWKPSPTRALSRLGVTFNTLTFFPMNLQDSISLVNLNLAFSNASTDSTNGFTFKFGLYSLNGSTLSLANSISKTRSFSTGNQNGFLSMSDTSATQNITPGTWFWGLVISSDSNSSLLLYNVEASVGKQNAFPGGFIGGVMTDSTNALPSAYSTSDLDTTGTLEMATPYIILTT